jgi:hypothetical protein
MRDALQQHPPACAAMPPPPTHTHTCTPPPPRPSGAHVREACDVCGAVDGAARRPPLRLLAHLPPHLSEQHVALLEAHIPTVRERA